MGRSPAAPAAALAALAAAVATPAHAQTNTLPPAEWSWGENIGWISWATPSNPDSGARAVRRFLQGFIWSENTGWINLGDGAGPYDNSTGATHGVNIDPSTQLLRGLAWSENIGWINFSVGDENDLWAPRLTPDDRIVGFA